MRLNIKGGGKGVEGNEIGGGLVFVVVVVVIFVIVIVVSARIVLTNVAFAAE
ncbi:hypothetical protein [Pseudomonas protegens]|uniref:hypothetical protein n=1 Tax=Pseudomonas protegens TaxID=380021 RepID=UPI00215EFA82|nr:hypothetical protein [Pseudomonas protegens]UVM08874.1 hypothetical protein LOY29_19750 [Pseudomonas protegens]